MAVCRPLFTDEEHAALQARVSITQSRTIQCYTSVKLVLTYDTGWQNVIRPKQNAASVHNDKNIS